MEAKAKVKAQRWRFVRDEEKQMEISAPEFVFTDAASRHDLYSLPQRKSNPLSMPGSKADGSQHHQWPQTSQGATRPARRIPQNPDTGTQSQQWYPSEANLDPRLEKLGIGMALGSPSRPPWLSQHKHDSQTSEISVIASTPPDSPAGNSAGDSKHKPRWRMLGGIFRKGTSHSSNNNTTPFYSLKPDAQLNLTAEDQPAKPSMHRERRIPEDFKPLSQKMVTGKRSMEHKQSMEYKQSPSRPLITKSYTSPVTAAPVNNQRPAPPPKDFVARPVPKRTVSAAPRLHIDIPDVKMERYSVMFGSVLGKPGASVMTRRQHKVERLKAIDDIPSEEPEEVQELRTSFRRATIPSPAQSPSYSLFPPVPTHQPEKKPSSLSSTAHHPPSLRRSNTAPTASPIQPVFKIIYPPHRDAKLLMSVDSPSPSTASPETPRGAPWTSEMSHSSRHSSPLEDVEVNPRQAEEVVIKLESRIDDTVLKQKPLVPAEPQDNRIRHPPRRDSKRPHDQKKHREPKTPQTQLQSRGSGDFSKHNHAPASSGSELNKPLPCPQSFDKTKALEARQASRNASPPVGQVKTTNPSDLRKASLLTYEATSLDPSLMPRKSSLQGTPRESAQIRTTRSPSLQTPEEYAKLQAEAKVQRQSSPPRSGARQTARGTDTKQTSQDVAHGFALQARTSASSMEQPMFRSSRLQESPASVHDITASPSGNHPPQHQNRQRQPSPHSQASAQQENPLRSSPASPAEISIARQISLSRRQQMMVPIVPKTVRQPQQATLVVPDQRNSSSVGNAGRRGHVSRKSSHAVVESI